MGLFSNFGFGGRRDDSFAFNDPLDFQGRGAQQATREATEAQLALGREALAEQRAARTQAREDLLPFTQLGLDASQDLVSLINDPQAQNDFIRNNPFFETLADDAQNRLFANQAARGKVGSGGTAQALQNSLVLLGSDLLQQGIQNRQNLVRIGQSSAAGQAVGELESTKGVTDLLTQLGNSQAAGAIGISNIQQQSRSNIASIGGAIASIFASDRRVKRDIKKIGEDKGLNIYQYKYIWSPATYIGFMAQEVQKLYPNAVLNINGILHVDYGAIYAA